MLCSKQADLSHMRTFGCLCYATNLIKGDKFGARAIKSVMMGYGTNQKGYKLYDLEAKSFFISRDVHFLEHIFPFRHCSTGTSALSKLVSEDGFFVPIRKSYPPINDDLGLDGNDVAPLNIAFLPSEEDDTNTTPEVPVILGESSSAPQDEILDQTPMRQHEYVEALVYTRRTSERPSRPPTW